MEINRKQLFILMVCLNSMTESVLRDLCRRFDFEGCNKASVKNLKDQIKQRLTEYLIEPAVELPTDKTIPKDKKSTKKQLFAIKVRRIYAVKNSKLIDPGQIRKIKFNG